MRPSGDWREDGTGMEHARRDDAERRTDLVCADWGASLSNYISLFCTDVGRRAVNNDLTVGSSGLL